MLFVCDLFIIWCRKIFKWRNYILRSFFRQGVFVHFYFPFEDMEAKFYFFRHICLVSDWKSLKIVSRFFSKTKMFLSPPLAFRLERRDIDSTITSQYFTKRKVILSFCSTEFVNLKNQTSLNNLCISRTYNLRL